MAKNRDLHFTDHSPCPTMVDMIQFALDGRDQSIGKQIESNEHCQIVFIGIKERVKEFDGRTAQQIASILEAEQKELTQMILNVRQDNDLLEDLREKNLISLNQEKRIRTDFENQTDIIQESTYYAKEKKPEQGFFAIQTLAGKIAAGIGVILAVAALFSILKNEPEIGGKNDLIGGNDIDQKWQTAENDSNDDEAPIEMGRPLNVPETFAYSDTDHLEEEVSYLRASINGYLNDFSDKKIELASEILMAAARYSVPVTILGNYNNPEEIKELLSITIKTSTANDNLSNLDLDKLSVEQLKIFHKEIPDYRDRQKLKEIIDQLSSMYFVLSEKAAEQKRRSPRTNPFFLSIRDKNTDIIIYEGLFIHPPIISLENEIKESWANSDLYEVSYTLFETEEDIEIKMKEFGKPKL